jgi:hypothetical protein
MFARIAGSTRRSADWAGSLVVDGNEVAPGTPNGEERGRSWIYDCLFRLLLRHPSTTLRSSGGRKRMAVR